MSEWRARWTPHQGRARPALHHAVGACGGLVGPPGHHLVLPRSTLKTRTYRIFFIIFLKFFISDIFWVLKTMKTRQNEFM